MFSIDSRGHIAAVYSPNNPVVQVRHDGAGRLVTTYTLGNVPTATWANATSLSNSLVVEQDDSTYAAASNMITTTNRQWFHDASLTAYGSLGTPYTRPAFPPLRSDTALVTDYTTYNAAGRLQNVSEKPGIWEGGWQESHSAG